ncbi:hypothetical protein [Frateuria defendens]|uniref:hypothetical protein n=1 Tax=Frateuria defendens TaxID=2219559 RepID=UPI00066FF3E1|nr:hypothetical protein [Frateuria defendens]
MKRPLPLLALALLPLAAAHAQTDPASEIRAGRAALVDAHPREARERFAAALAQPGLPRAERYAAALGLGRAALWLGDYAAAAGAFQLAREQAEDEAARQAATTGLAQALNAQDYPRQAYALVAPYAKGEARPTLELLRAAQAVGWQDKSPGYLAAATPPAEQGYLGTQYRLSTDDMRYALAPRVDAGTDFSHDSENLDTWRVGAAFLGAPIARDGLVQRWGASADTTHVDDDGRSRRVNDAALLAQLRAGDSHYFDLALGAGRSGSWTFLQGYARWTLQPNDRFSVSAAAERAPILSAPAIDHRLAYDTYSVSTSLRPATHLYVLPTYYRQTFSDGNRRDGGTLRVVLSPYDIPDTRAALGAELSGRIYHSDQPSRGVYFNPANYRSAQVGLIGVYSLTPAWRLHAVASTGRQVINGTGARIYTLGLTLDGRLPHNGRLQLRLGRSSVAGINQGGSGYWNNTVGLSISYPL